MSGIYPTDVWATCERGLDYREGTFHIAYIESHRISIMCLLLISDCVDILVSVALIAFCVCLVFL